MTFIYNHLSPGYAGVKSKNMALNAQYCALLLDELKNHPARVSQIIMFPQKIPRGDFYNELYHLETKFYKEQFDNVITELKAKHSIALKCLLDNPSEETSRTYINFSNLLSRYGRFEHLINHFPQNYIGPYQLEIEQIKENAKIDFLLSQGEQITVHEQIELAEKFLDNDDVTDREKIMLLNQIIVNYYKYQKHHTQEKKVFELSKTFLDFVLKFENNNFLNMVYCSVAYRGLAMVSEFGESEQEKLLNKAENLGRNARPQTEIENILVKENLFPCVQTLSKWALRKNEIHLAEHHLQEMIALDPYDSTGHSELGFFYNKIEKYNEAAHHFLKAMTLGPPGAGMNAYYYAKTLEALGKNDEAITYLYESTKLDEQAISPWLDLMTHFKNIKNHAKVTEIAKLINQTPLLFEQLEEHEAAYIKSYLK